MIANGSPAAHLPSPRLAPDRNDNLSLLSAYGPNAWLIRNYQLESQAKEVEVEVETWKEKVVEVNRKRRVFQVSFPGYRATTCKGFHC